MIELTPEECKLLYEYILKTTFLPRVKYEELTKIVNKIYEGMKE